MKRASRIALGALVGLSVWGFSVLRHRQLNTELVEAVRRDPAEVEELLRAGADPNTRDADGTAVVLHATIARKPEVVALLAERGADLNATDRNGRTALHQSAAFGHDVMVQILTERPVTVDRKDDAQRTPLMLAVSAGYPDCVRALLEAGADPNLPDREGRTPLVAAAGAGLLQVSELLMENGAKVDARDGKGETALIHALKIPSKGSEPQSLNASVASLPTGQRAPFGNERKASREPEQPAFSRDLVALLLASSPDVSVQDAQGHTVLDLAVGRLTAAQIDELRRRGARCGTDTDLLIAAALHRTQAAIAALTRGAKPNSRDLMRHSALWWAVQHRDQALASALLERKADPGGDQSPLIRAVVVQDPEMTRLLLNHGALERLPAGTDPPLLLAAQQRSLPLMRILLASGADANAGRPDGTTPLHEAIAAREPAVVDFLLAHGADVRATLGSNTAPRTVLGRACMMGGKQIAALVYARGARFKGESTDWLLRMQRRTANPSLDPLSQRQLRESADCLKYYVERETR